MLLIPAQEQAVHDFIYISARQIPQRYLKGICPAYPDDRYAKVYEVSMPRKTCYKTRVMA